MKNEFFVKIKAFFTRAFEKIKSVFCRILDKSKAVFKSAWEKIKPIFQRFNEKIKPVFKRISEKLRAVNWKEIGRAVLYPHTAIVLTITPLAALFLIYMLINGEGGLFSIASYIFSFYVLVVICFRVPEIVEFFKRIKKENRYLDRFLSDRELRVRISLYFALIINVAYAIFQLVLGLVHSSLWYYSLGGYYIILSLMRFFVVRHDRKAEAERLLDRGRICKLVGILLLVMTLVLSGAILHMIVLDVTIVHHQITTIAMAAYTFTALTLAIVGIVKDRDKKSLVFMVSKAVSLVAALVSVITLENAMITVFGGEEQGSFSKVMTASTGAVICAAVVAIAVYIIVIANKYLQNTGKTEEKTDCPENKIFEKN